MLKIGSFGLEVRSLQTKLNSLGFSVGNADGIFGKKTDAAVKSFQKSLSLTIDGIVGPKTLQALERRVSPPVPSKSEVTPGKPLLWYPKAIIPEERMRTSGEYALGYPKGAIIHHSAGSDNGIYEYGISQGFVYFVINRDGSVIQGFPLNRYGSHAGYSRWKGLAGDVSDDLVGIEIVCAGNLEKVGDRYKAWFGKYFEKPEVRSVQENNENIAAGDYHKFTVAQERSAIELVQWLKNNNPNVFSYDLVLGHDEVSGPAGIGYWRKVDPGASLSMTMSEFRKVIKGENLVQDVV